MPRCPAEADKAIRLAWERERKLVSKGLGTRDWTPEQQQDILEYGKAYDDEGKAFEGQHMKSAAQYPEHQSNPDNIQFLTRKEHLEAHNGSWQNPSNWYYDPIEKQFFDFGDGAPIPCKIIKLSCPIVPATTYDTVSGKVEQAQKELSSGTDPPLENIPQSIDTDTLTCISETGSLSDKGARKTFWDGIKNIPTVAKDFSENHPVLTTVLKVGLGLATVYGTGKAIGSISKTSQVVGSSNSVIPSQAMDAVGKAISEAVTPIFKNSESILKQSGYAVAKSIGLSDLDRQKVLRNIITNGILSKEAVCKCLENFINLHKNQSTFAEAVSKWKLDLTFVREAL